MGKKGFVLCVCQGTCPSFHQMDIFQVLSDVRREKMFDYVCLHPQLCMGDGEEFLKVLLAGGGDGDTIHRGVRPTDAGEDVP